MQCNDVTVSRKVSQQKYQMVGNVKKSRLQTQDRADWSLVTVQLSTWLIKQGTIELLYSFSHDGHSIYTVRAPSQAALDQKPLLNTSHTYGQRSQYINSLWKWGKKIYKPRLIMARVRYPKYKYILNFQISKLNLRFQINSNRFSRNRSFWHYCPNIYTVRKRQSSCRQ